MTTPPTDGTGDQNPIDPGDRSGGATAQQPQGQTPDGAQQSPGQVPNGAQPNGQVPHGAEQAYGAQQPQGQASNGAQQFQGAQPSQGQAPNGAQQPYGQVPNGAQQPYGQAPNGAQPYQQPHGDQPGYGAPQPKSRKGLITGLIAGAGVILLVLIVVVVLFLTGVLGAKVKDQADFKDKFYDFGKDSGVEHCSPWDDTVLKSMGSEGPEGLPDKTTIYVCSSVDLTDASAVTQASGEDKVMLGMYTESGEKFSDYKFDDGKDFTDQKDAWALTDGPWMIASQTGSQDDAKKVFGGHDWDLGADK